MAILRIEKEDTAIEPVFFDLPKESGVKVNIGRDVQNDIVLQDKNIAPFHGIIVRASSGFYVLLNCDNLLLTVNDLEVLGLKILRHNDITRLGDGAYKITYQDISKIILEDKSTIVDLSCLFCQEKFRSGDEIIMCPKCDTAYHLTCWKIIYNSACVLPNCGYFIDRLDEA